MGTNNGVVAFGNWIVDKIAMTPRGAPKFDPEPLADFLKEGGSFDEAMDHFRNGRFDNIEPLLVFPVAVEGTLNPISSIGEGTGGAPYNVLVDFAKLGAGIPLGGVGIVGKDADGDFILEDLRQNKISSGGMMQREGARTSFTHVYQPDGGNRGFVHFSADTNDKLSVEDIGDYINFIRNYRICHAGYALLLKALDARDSEHGTKMARALKMIQDRGVSTSLAVVSHSDTSLFPDIVVPALKYTNIHMPNEYEATYTTGIEVKDKDSARDAAQKMFDEFGVKDTVVIHMGDYGSFGMTSDGSTHYQPVHANVPIKVTAGAGDAYETGMIFSEHEGKGLEYGMRLATAMAAICLGGNSCTDSMMDLGFTDVFMA